ncbi:Sentrin-specific protease 1 [Orchesella cincta]|uniref:Sentrin-specific protease 1 n=1 Tax=Orchesella cincta TaxID=48709 RepID=A0A1D2MW70_ORCCI|nr:Sentrin-specific protease 1 [Orchesella cincta]
MERFKQKYGDGGGLENKPPSKKKRATQKNPNKTSHPNVPSSSISISNFDGKAPVRGNHQDEYMDAIVENWNGNDPSELFKVENWKIWIKREAASKNLNEYNKSKSLTSFAKALMTNLSSQPYVSQICSKLDENGSRTFMELGKKFEEKETLRLLDAVLCQVSNDESNSSEDDSILEPPEKSPRLEVGGIDKGSKDGIVTPVVSSPTTCSPDGLFLSPLPCTGVSRLSLSANFSTPSKNSLLKRRNSRELSRKKRRDDKLSTKRRIKNTESPENLRCQNDSLMIEKPLRLSLDNLGLPAPLEYGEVCPESEVTLRDEDLVIENPTPPVSPYTFVDDDFPDIEYNRQKPSRFSFETSTVECTPVSIRPQISCKVNNKNQAANLRAYNNSNVCNELSSPADEGKNGSFFEHDSFSKSFELNPEINLDSLSVKSKGVLSVSSMHEANVETTVDQNKENFFVDAEEILAKFPKPPSAPQLTLHMFDEIRKALEKPEKEKIVSGFSLNILREDFAIVNDEEDWLIDLHMDFYLELIKERSKQPGYQSVYIFHSFFYTLLTEGKDPGYLAVQETTGEDDIFKYDLVFFPVNRSHHWRLVVVQFSKKLIQCFDSMKHDNSEILRNIGRFLKKEYRRKYECNDNGAVSNYFDHNNWTVENVASDIIPQQKNAIDCGIFCLQYAEYLSRLENFDFDQSHIRYFRKRMLFEFLSKKLLTS